MSAIFYRQKKHLPLPWRPPFHTFKNIKHSYDVRIKIVTSSSLVKPSLLFLMIERVSKKDVVPFIAIG